MLKLNRFSTQTVFVKNYEIRLFKSNYTHIPMYLCRVSFLTTLDIHKDYFDAKIIHAKKYPSSLFSSKKLLRL